MKPRVLFVGRTRYSLPLAPGLARKWDALAEAMEIRVLARSLAGSPRRNGIFTLSGPLRPRRLDGAAFYATLPLRIARELRRFRPDAVMTQSPYEAGAALAARRLVRSDARVVLELHGDWRTATRLYGSPLRRLLEPITERVAETALRHADAVRTVSGYTTGLLAPLGLDAAGEFPAYVDLSAFVDRPVEPLPARPGALFVGVLERYKSLDVLVEAWRLAAPGVSGARLTLVGDGPLRPAVAELVAELPDQAAWKPRLTSDEVARALDEASVLVLPSRSEGLPRIVIEAFCRGRGVVGARAGGIPDIVENEVSGLLVAPDDPGVLAHALVRVLADPELQVRLGHSAREQAESWVQTPEEFAGKTLALVERAAARPAKEL